MRYSLTRLVFLVIIIGISIVAFLLGDYQNKEIGLFFSSIILVIALLIIYLVNRNLLKRNKLDELGIRLPRRGYVVSGIFLILFGVLFSLGPYWAGVRNNDIAIYAYLLGLVMIFLGGIILMIALIYYIRGLQRSLKD